MRVMAAGTGKGTIPPQRVRCSPDRMSFAKKTCNDVKTAFLILMTVEAEICWMDMHKGRPVRAMGIMAQGTGTNGSRPMMHPLALPEFILGTVADKTDPFIGLSCIILASACRNLVATEAVPFRSRPVFVGSTTLMPVTDITG
jgi:hypothetical protein